MTKLRFLWIDDDAKREHSAKSMETYEYRNGAIRIKAIVDFLSLRKADAIKSINKDNQLLKYDLILIDHVLTSAIGMIRKGTTLAEVIREKVPKCPIVGVTAAIIKKA